MRRFSQINSWANIAILSVLVLACKKEEAESKPRPTSDAGLKPVPAVDPALAQAVAAASARPSAANSEGGPPASGIFEPGLADKELAAGAAPKLALGSEGSDPKVLLASGVKAGLKGAGSIEMAIQSDPRQGAIPVELGVAIEVQKPKPADPDAAVAPSGFPVNVRITSAKIAMPGVPNEIQTSVAKLKGSHVDYVLLENGAGANFRFENAKGVGDDWRDVTRSLADALALATIPSPGKAVGAGAYWMVTTRDNVFGLDLLTYRLVKVLSVSDGKASLSVSTKRYSAGQTFELQGLATDVPRTMLEFHATSESKLDMQGGWFLPSGGELNSNLQAALGKPGEKAARGVLEIASRARFVLDSAK